MQHLWVFAFLAPVPEATADVLAQRLKALLAGWQAHGTPVSSRVALRYGHFLFIEATSGTSGCSIDWLHHALEALFAELGLTVADHSTIFYWNEAGEIESVPFPALETALAAGRLTAQTVVFDPQAIHQGQLERWEVPLYNTWMARYLPQEAR